MAIERKAIARELARAGMKDVRVVQTGIGKDAIVASLKGLFAGGPAPDVVVLAGACGGLRPVEDVPLIARVIDERGSEWTSGLGFTPTGRTLVAVDRVVATPQDKRRLADETGAAIVDMESHAFAAECERLGASGHGLLWSIVRGISDSPEESLPAEVLGWITPSGETRSGRAVFDMVRSPRLVPHITRVLRRSSRVLPLVGRRVVEVLRSADRGRGVE
ncbi:MAG: hypothetical protein AB7K52_12805 [Phycisphaerales bacterium]